MAAAQPAIFTWDQTGQGQGLIYSAAGTLADAASPVKAREAVVIYCSGLGPVAPAVAAGTAAPSSPLSWTANPVAVTIGGQQRKCFSPGWSLALRDCTR